MGIRLTRLLFTRKISITHAHLPSPARLHLCAQAATPAQTRANEQTTNNAQTKLTHPERCTYTYTPQSPKLPRLLNIHSGQRAYDICRRQLRARPEEEADAIVGEAPKPETKVRESATMSEQITSLQKHEQHYRTRGFLLIESLWIVLVV